MSDVLVGTDLGPPRDSMNSRAASILNIIRNIGVELHLPDDRLEGLSLDTSFDKDLGLDSLTRVELISRVERQFNVTLPEQAFNQLENVHDLLAAVAHAPIRLTRGPSGHSLKAPDSQDIQSPTLSVPSIPTAAHTLVDVLNWHVAQHGTRTHLTLCEDDVNESTLTYGQLRDGALAIASGLQGLGIGHGDTVAIMLPTSLDYFFSFLGVLLVGAVPVPIYPPARPNQIEDHLQRHAAILNNCQAKALLTTSAAKGIARLLKLRATSIKMILSPDEVSKDRGAGAGFVAPPLSPDDTAFLQYTSGSTGNPKGVILTHANLLANIRAMGEALKAGPSDVFVSWLPLYHDMGLIGAWMGSLYFASRFIVMSPFAFLGHPDRWLKALDRYKGTLTSAPNFAYELCLKRIRDEDIAGPPALDLRSVRVMCNGAEAVNPDTISRFMQRFSRFGLRETAMMPVYGLAENSVGLAFPPLGRMPRIDVIERDIFVRLRRAASQTQEGRKSNPLRFVACGHPLRGHEIRIVDDSDRELPERHEGHLQFRGPSSTSGYLGNAAETARLFHRKHADDRNGQSGAAWLDSGDLAYLAEGDIFVTGRIKDVIKHAGRNIYPEELEAAVGELTGVRKGCVAVFGNADPKLGTERLVVLAETRETADFALADIRTRINAAVADVIGAAPDVIVMAMPHTVLKTSSGKIRRSACRRLYESGHIDMSGPKSPRSRSVKWQVARFTLAAVPNQVRRFLGAGLVTLNACWVLVLTTLVALVAWPMVACWPRLSGRWRIARGAARLVAFGSGIKITVLGREHVPDSPCIFVANHSSYIDVLALAATLQRVVTFTAKAELARATATRIPLTRLDTQFVERFDQRKSVADAKHVSAAGKAGKSLLFFPEGTFTRRPGLLPFHMGAFQVAVETGLPIVPIVLRGTRSILHDESWVVRRGDVSVRFLPPIKLSRVTTQPGPTAWEQALELRDTARQAILKYNGEADLGQERGFI